MTRILLVLVPLALSACAAPYPTSGSGRGMPEAEVPATPECIVAASRQVQLIGGRPGVSRPVGTISGVRNGVTSGEDPASPTAGVIGGAGSQPWAPPAMESRTPMPSAVEYTVREGTSERVIVQNIDYSGVVLPAGATCRVIGAGSGTRVTWS
jgi:hypothetical protein